MKTENGTIVKCFSVFSVIIGLILTLCFNGFLHLDKKIDKIYSVVIDIITKMDRGYYGQVFSFDKELTAKP